MADSTLWWLAAGALIALELVSGTFYLLMIALGLVAAALSAHAGSAPVMQWVTAALVGGGSVAGWWGWRRAHPRAAANAAANLAMDVGETVDVSSWQPNHHTTVKYRGAQWEASLAPGWPAQSGPHRITRVEGNRLVLQPASSS